MRSRVLCGIDVCEMRFCVRARTSLRPAGCLMSGAIVDNIPVHACVLGRLCVCAVRAAVHRRTTIRKS